MKQLNIRTQITNRSDGSLNLYLKDISKLPQLTAKEETDLATKAQGGDKKALEKLVTGNLRFVISVAKQYQHFGVPLPDLIAAGNIGLIKAAEKFDPTRGFKLISYAVWWIRQSITNSLSEHLKVIRLPANCEAAINEYNKAKERLEQKLGRDASIDEVIESIPILKEQDYVLSGKEKSKSKFDTKKNKKDLITTSYKPVSLETPMTEDGNFTLNDTLAHTEALDNMTVWDKEKQKERLMDALKSLTPLELKVISMKYGLSGEEPRSYDEIGMSVDLTGERIRQIQFKAFRKLKRVKNLKRLSDDFLNS